MIQAGSKENEKRASAISFEKFYSEGEQKEVARSVFVCFKAEEILQGNYSKCIGVVGTCGSTLLIAFFLGETGSKMWLSEDKRSARGLMRKEV